jgi:GTP-binding protein EngB required for normal cell division
MNGEWGALLSAARELGVEPRIRALQERAAADLCAVAFLGEYSRGKSSVINALIERPLLPVDVRPTTIGVVSVCHADRESARLHAKGGARDLPLDRQVLRQFQSPETGGLGAPDGGWLELGLPLPSSLRRFRLLDTPGVNDLGETSPDVLLRLLPHVDLAVYVLDASAGMSRSEQSFIREREAAAHGAPCVVFVNKLDRVDADDPDEVEEVKDELRRQVRELTGAATPVVFGAAHAHLDTLVAQLSAAADVALARRRERLLAMAGRYLQEHIQSERQLLDLEEKDGRAALDRLSQAGPGLREAMGAFRSHARGTGEVPLQLMVRRSLLAWQDDARRDLLGQVRLYADLHGFAQHGLARALEKVARGWADGHVGPIQQFLSRHARASAHEAARLFAQDGLRLSTDAVLFALNPHREDGRVEVSGTGDGGVAARYGIAAMGSLAGGLIAAPLGVLGFAAGLAIAESLKKQKDASMRDEIERAIPGLVQRAAVRLEAEVQAQARAHFDRLDAALERALELRLERVETERAQHQASDAERGVRRRQRRESLARAERCLRG